MDTEYSVYCLTNMITNEKYIGATKNPHARWETDGARYDHGKISKAIKQYGWDNFKKEIIESGLTKAQAEEKEQYYISLFNTIEDGYNIQPGGNLFTGMFGESNPFYNDHRFAGENHPMYGKKHTEKTREKMSRNHWDCKGSNNPFYDDHRFAGVNHPNRKPVQCIETGEIYVTVTEAERKTGIPRQNIRKQINHLISHAGGYHWRDVDKNLAS